jgi:hypothetical protein
MGKEKRFVVLAWVQEDMWRGGRKSISMMK